ncbi:unnamed protein product [Allacma fusca]|uniref:Uncharacterized protein n=1 Tax=Allacma fusca TaxID=39272 RepID=A0A8J2P149_9HEXA|nr:unnamed protein product [Allacma fusca]
MGAFPFRILEPGGRLAVETNWKKKSFFYGYFSLTVLYCVLHFTTLVYCLVFKKGYFLSPNFTVHALLSIGWSYAAFGALSLYILWPDTTVQIFNTLFSEQYRSPQTSKSWKEYSLQEIIGITAPIPFFYMSISLVSLTHFLNSDRLYSVLAIYPVDIAESPVMYVFVSVIDIILFVFPESACYFTIVFQLLIFMLIDGLLGKHNHLLRAHKSLDGARAEHVIEEHIQSCQRVELLIQLFNHNFMFVIFSLKSFIITFSILLWYSAILFHETEPFVSAVYALMGIDLNLMFVVLYDHAFGVTVKMFELKQRITEKCSGIKCQRKRKLALLKIKSIPNFGIKIGNFQVFQQTSTTILVDFVLKNLAGLVVATM